MTTTVKKTANDVSHTANMLAADYEARKAELELTAAPTKESIADGISAAMDAAAGCFTEMELRVRGDNGNLYPISVDGEPQLPEGTEGMGIESVNSLAFLQDQLLGGICWKLETMLEANAKKRSDTEGQLAWARKAADEGRVDDWVPASKKRFLDQLEYQYAMLEVAFDEACDAFERNLGKRFLTKVEREAQAIAARRAKRSSTASREPNDKLARFKG